MTEPTTPVLAPTLLAALLWDSPRFSFAFKISRDLRIDSLLFATTSSVSLEEGGGSLQARCHSGSPAPTGLDWMALRRDHDGDPGDHDGDPGDHDGDPGDHVQPIFAITMRRSRRSR